MTVSSPPICRHMKTLINSSYLNILHVCFILHSNIITLHCHYKYLKTHYLILQLKNSDVFGQQPVVCSGNSESVLCIKNITASPASVPGNGFIYLQNVFIIHVQEIFSKKPQFLIPRGSILFRQLHITSR